MAKPRMVERTWLDRQLWMVLVVYIVAEHLRRSDVIWTGSPATSRAHTTTGMARRTPARRPLAQQRMSFTAQSRQDVEGSPVIVLRMAGLRHHCE